MSNLFGKKFITGLLAAALIGAGSFLATKAATSVNASQVRQIVTDMHPKLDKTKEFDTRLDQLEQDERSQDAQLETIIENQKDLKEMLKSARWR